MALHEWRRRKVSNTLVLLGLGCRNLPIGENEAAGERGLFKETPLEGLHLQPVGRGDLNFSYGNTNGPFVITRNACSNTVR